MFLWSKSSDDLCPGADGHSSASWLSYAIRSRHELIIEETSHGSARTETLLQWNGMAVTTE